MNCWAVLGVDRTADTSVIRKAYKQQLLIYHPEDDPAGYQKVREAYNAAMNEAKYLAKQTEENTEAAEEDTEAGENTEPEAPSDADERSNRRENEDLQTVTRRFFAEQIQDKANAENDFMARLERLLNDHGKRNDPEAWQELLSDDVLWDIQSKSRIDGRMLRLFSEQYHHLSGNIWGIIEMHTGLFDKINNQMDAYPARFVDIYTFATQKIVKTPRLEEANISAGQIIKKPHISWWRYCFRFPVYLSVLILGNVAIPPLYILSVLVRFVLFVFRRNWKIIMWEHTFTYINRWGKRYDFKYIDIVKVENNPAFVILYLKGKRIRFDTESFVNADRLLARISRYGRKEGHMFFMG